MNNTKKHLEILTEEPSAEAALKVWLPKWVGKEVSVNIISHQGKGDLLNKLPGKLSAYAKLFKEGQKIVVLLDRDKEDCKQLKEKMEKIAREAGVLSKSRAKKGESFLIVNRIAIEELEAWFLGDEKAVCTAYPRLAGFPKELQRKNPDAITDPFEVLARQLKSAGYRSLGGKIELSRKVAAHLDARRNRSASFNTFCEGISACLR